MDRFLRYLNEGVDDTESFIRKVVLTAAIIIISVAITKIITAITHSVAEKEHTARKIARFTRLFATLFVIISVFYLWFYSFQGVGLLVWAILIFLALSLKDMLVDIIFYIYVLLKRPFKDGDIIEIDGSVGVVESIDILRVHIQELGAIIHTLTPSGRYFTVPNHIFMEKTVFNYTRDTNYLMQETYILVDFHADRDKALRLAGQFIYAFHEKSVEAIKSDEKNAKSLKIFRREMEYIDKDVKPNIWEELDDNGFRIYVQYLCHSSKIGVNKRYIETGLYDLFDKNNIDMPVPQYVRIAE